VRLALLLAAGLGLQAPEQRSGDHALASTTLARTDKARASCEAGASRGCRRAPRAARTTLRRLRRSAAPYRRSGEADPPAAGPRGAGDLDRAVLRPRLRLRHHPAVEPARARPDPRRRGEDRAAGARGLVGVGLHDVGHELVRRGHAGGARDPPGRDVRRHGRRNLDPRRIRRPGVAARGRLRGHPGRPQPVRRPRDPPQRTRCTARSSASSAGRAP
jgi:hypothetical protein